MKNVIRTKAGKGFKIWKRRSVNLTSGEINCGRCGAWTRVTRFTDKHFKDEYSCRTCKKELNADKPKPKRKSAPKKKLQWPEHCPHKPFFNCKVVSECKGCYYNPTKKLALLKIDKDDPNKIAKDHWFYGNKAHAKKALKLLDDIRLGRGLQRGGNRTYFKHARKSEID